MNKLKDILEKSISKKDETLDKEIEFIKNNKWLGYSSQIAKRVLASLRRKQISQLELAELLGVKPQRVSKIVKGKENLTLQAIYNLSHVLDTKLITFPEYEYSKIQLGWVSSTTDSESFKATIKPISYGKTEEKYDDYLSVITKSSPLLNEGVKLAS